MVGMDDERHRPGQGIEPLQECHIHPCRQYHRQARVDSQAFDMRDLRQLPGQFGELVGAQ